MANSEICWKLRVKKGTYEVEVSGLTPTRTKEYFDELAKKYLDS